MPSWLLRLRLLVRRCRPASTRSSRRARRARTSRCRVPAVGSNDRARTGSGADRDLVLRDQVAVDRELAGVACSLRSTTIACLRKDVFTLLRRQLAGSPGDRSGDDRAAYFRLVPKIAQVDDDEQHDRRRCATRSGCCGSTQRHDRTVPLAVRADTTDRRTGVMTRSRGALTRYRRAHARQCVDRPRRAASSPAVTCCTVRSAPARAAASTWPTTRGCAAGSRSRCCTRRSADDAAFLAPIPGRGPARRVAAPPAHRHRLRLGRRRRAVHGARAARGRQPPVDARPGHAADRRRRPRASVATSRRRSSTRTRAMCCTATSSRRTSCSTSTASCASPTSVSRARSPRRAGPSPRAAMFGTARVRVARSRRRVCSSTRGPISTRLALVLVESVTGRVPFAADTTIGMLTARTQRPLIAPEELGPLAAVIDRAGRVEPDDRYPDAGTMRQALADVGDALPPPGPLVLAGMVDQPIRTRRASRRRRRRRCSTRTQRVAAGTGGAGTREARDGTRCATPSDRRASGGSCRSSSRLVLLATVALAASASPGSSGASTLAVPGFTGRNADAGRAAREARGSRPYSVIAAGRAGSRRTSSSVSRRVRGRGPARATCG